MWYTQKTQDGAIAHARTVSELLKKKKSYLCKFKESFPVYSVLRPKAAFAFSHFKLICIATNLFLRSLFFVL